MPTFRAAFLTRSILEELASGVGGGAPARRGSLDKGVDRPFREAEVLAMKLGERLKVELFGGGAFSSPNGRYPSLRAPNSSRLLEDEDGAHCLLILDSDSDRGNMLCFSGASHKFG